MKADLLYYSLLHCVNTLSDNQERDKFLNVSGVVYS